MEEGDGSVGFRTKDGLPVLLQPVAHSAVLHPAGHADGLAGGAGLVVGVAHRQQGVLQTHPCAEDLTRREAVARLEGISPADLPAVDPGLLRQDVHHPFHGEVGLVRSEPPHGPCGRIVRVDGAGLDVHVGHLVRAAGVAGGPFQHLVAHARVRARVPDDASPDRHQVALLVAPHRVLHPHGVALGVKAHALRARKRQQDWLAREHRQEGSLRLHVEVLFRSECPAVGHLGHPDLLLGKRQERSHLSAVVPHSLSLRVEMQGDAGFGVGNGQTGLGLEEGVLDELGLEGLRRDVRGRGQSPVHVAPLHLRDGKDVAVLLEGRRAGAHCLEGIRHGRLDLVAHV